MNFPAMMHVMIFSRVFLSLSLSLSPGFSSCPITSLFTEAGHRVRGALLPEAPFVLQIANVQLVAKTFHDLFGEQVIHQGCLDAAVVVHQLEQLKVRLHFFPFRQANTFFW